ncbi:MAG: 16S rRNA processing protein RimM [Ignavibacteria bacterium]|nr:MAG: 16S rRNA processing protein RimM [Ignavibacteria bacterium]KAF0161193.1 MAG: 16S rRNA processing protein RimM [Ignavibacteria bacterium]
MSDHFLIAEIKSAFGVNGFVAVDSFSDFNNRFFELEKVYIEIFGNLKQFIVEDVKQTDNKIVLKFAGFHSDADVNVLIGRKVFVDQENLVRLDADTYFIHDLVKSQVFRNSQLIGTVEDVFVFPANDVIVVVDNSARKILIPAIKDYIKTFNSEEKRLDLVNDCDLLYDDEN